MNRRRERSTPPAVIPRSGCGRARRHARCRVVRRRRNHGADRRQVAGEPDDAAGSGALVHIAVEAPQVTRHPPDEGGTAAEAPHDPGLVSVVRSDVVLIGVVLIGVVLTRVGALGGVLAGGGSGLLGEREFDLGHRQLPVEHDVGCRGDSPGNVLDAHLACDGVDYQDLGGGADDVADAGEPADFAEQAGDRGQGRSGGAEALHPPRDAVGEDGRLPVRVPRMHARR
ncbi:hypothetical protein, partial [Nostocoides australiense]|uniref:hypothetical protein n=1 Tax=Nostocoides australiense TaxID=99480 RepID=UPI00138F801C